MMPVRAAAERLRYGLSRYQALDATSPVGREHTAAMRKANDRIPIDTHQRSAERDDDEGARHRRSGH
jgi:hypothetical protein